MSDTTERFRVGTYGDWCAGGSLSNDADQAPGYPVMDGARAIAWFILRDDAETFAEIMQERAQPNRTLSR